MPGRPVDRESDTVLFLPLGRRTPATSSHKNFSRNGRDAEDASGGPRQEENDDDKVAMAHCFGPPLHSSCDTFKKESLRGRALFPSPERTLCPLASRARDVDRVAFVSVSSFRSFFLYIYRYYSVLWGLCESFHRGFLSSGRTKKMASLVAWRERRAGKREATTAIASVFWLRVASE